MEETRGKLNPYDVLGVPQAASKQEIIKAFASAMKAKVHPAPVISDAQKRLLDPEKRLLADFLRPILPPIKRLKREDYSALERDDPSFPFLAEFDGLDAALEQALSELDPAQQQELNRLVASQQGASPAL